MHGNHFCLLSFQDKGFILPDKKTTVTKAEIEALHEKVNKDKESDFRPLWKLNESHFMCRNSQRQG